MYSLAIFLPLLTLADKIPFYPASAHLLLQTQSTFAPTQKTTIHCPAYNITAESTDIKGDGEWTNVLKEVEAKSVLTNACEALQQEGGKQKLIEQFYASAEPATLLVVDTGLASSVKTRDFTAMNLIATNGTGNLTNVAGQPYFNTTADCIAYTNNCTGNGVCTPMYGNSPGVLYQCFCSTGYRDYDCSTEDSLPLAGIVIFTSLFTIVTLVIFIGQFYKIKSS